MAVKVSKRAIIILAILIMCLIPLSKAVRFVKGMPRTPSDMRPLVGLPLASLRSMQKTSDGGYVFAGDTGLSDGDFSDNHGGEDVWVAKLDVSGDIEWKKLLGGSGWDSIEFGAVEPIRGGGYIVAARTASNDGDVSGNHGGDSDIWIFKLNASGELEWQKCFGGSGDEWTDSIRQTRDGGYLFVGGTNSFPIGEWGDDVWLVKLNSLGDMEWQRLIDGSGDGDWLDSIYETEDGGYIATGCTDMDDSHWGAWVIKLNASGEIEWQRQFGDRDRFDSAECIRQTGDGGYILVGITQGGLNNSDVLVVKMNALGNVEWQQHFIALVADRDTTIDVLGVMQTGDGNYTIVLNRRDHPDLKTWLVKLEKSGVMEWKKYIGASAAIEGRSPLETVYKMEDNGDVAVGYIQTDDSARLGAGIVKLVPDETLNADEEVPLKLQDYK